MKTEKLTNRSIFFNMLFKPKNIADVAMHHSIKAHRSVRHKYDGHSYKLHLKMGVNVGLDFIYLIPSEDREDVIGGIWEHDSIEDAMQSYNDVKKATNKRIAELAYACTNEKGKTRSERGGDKYYTDMRSIEYATFVKLCDRIANITYSKMKKSRMFEVYKKEHIHFKKMLYTIDTKYYPMWCHLEDLLGL